VGKDVIIKDVSKIMTLVSRVVKCSCRRLHLVRAGTHVGDLNNFGWEA